MVKITIENLGQKTIAVRSGSPVLRSLHENGIDWMHACGGKGRCTTCKIIVVSGMENLSSITPAETRYRQQNLLGLNERLACQAAVKGSINIRVAEEYKLPHMTYSD